MASRSFIDYLLNPGPDEAELAEALRSATGVADDIADAFVLIDAAVAATAADVVTINAQVTYVEGVISTFDTDAAAAIAAIAADRASALAAIDTASTTAQGAIDTASTDALADLATALGSAVTTISDGETAIATASSTAVTTVEDTGALIVTDMNIIKSDTQGFRDEAETARDEAVAAAASVDIPVIAPGDAGKVLTVKGDETGSEWLVNEGTISALVAGDGIDIDATDPANPIISAVADVTFSTVMQFWIGTNLEVVELAPSARLIGMAGGNGVFDGFNALDFVDVAGATNLDTSTDGELTPTVTPDTDSSPTPSTPGWNLADLTIWDRGWSIDNGKTVSKIGIYSTGANTFQLKIVERTGAAVYAVTASESFSHPGGGWAWKTLAAPVAIPGSGTFYAGVYQATGTIDGDSSSRGFYASGEMTGTGNSCTENTGTVPSMAVEYSVGIVDAMEVESQVINLSEAPEWGRMAAFVMENDAGVNSDIIFKIARDGVDFETLVMAEISTRHDGSLFIDSGIVDLTGLDSGTTAKWSITTANGKSPDVLAVAAVFGVY